MILGGVELPHGANQNRYLMPFLKKSRHLGIILASSKYRFQLGSPKGMKEGNDGHFHGAKENDTRMKGIRVGVGITF